MRIISGSTNKFKTRPLKCVGVRFDVSKKLATAVGNKRSIPGEDLFFRDHHVFGRKIGTGDEIEVFF